MVSKQTDVLIIGAGIVGIATAYYLKKISAETTVILIDQGQPMAFTSAQSGENYRNWWPHPTMKSFTEHSISLMEDIANESDQRINMTRRGYALATREDDISELIAELNSSYVDDSEQQVRIHLNQNSGSYQPALTEDWRDAPEGVDVLQNTGMIKKYFPNFSSDIKNIIHIRNAGMLDSQQLGAFMLESFREAGGKRLIGTVTEINKAENFKVKIDGDIRSISVNKIINAAGPFVADIAKLLDIELPVFNQLQQKIAFPDSENVIPRIQPFSIDLDPQIIDWEADEIELMEADEEYSWLTKQLPSGMHSRPEGGDHGNWLKLGWAFNEFPVEASFEPILDDFYPEIVLRGAARLNPALKAYYGKLPRKTLHYGGYYTMTEENWPLIGKTAVEGFYINGAMSGFGTMAACAGGELCAQWVTEQALPSYADDLSLDRYKDQELIKQLQSLDSGKL